MNPGKIVAPRRADQDLRLGASYDPATPTTHFKFPADGGSFAHATLRCVGIGKCRNLDSEEGVMCPSYMVTHEERDSTRGRAHLLWEMLRGERAHAAPIGDGLTDEAVKQSLDLCLACKGCKGDCPTNVDIATYKAEFLSHYYEHRARPRHAYAFGLIDRWARLTAPIAGLANLATHLPVTRELARLAMGVDRRRQIPSFAPQTFRAWFHARTTASRETDGEVLLWVDTFNNYFRPETSRAAVEVLEHLGFHVHIPAKPLCCGRPLYDFGMLDRAQQYLEDTLTTLAPHIDAGRPMVVLEPSCASVFRDELHELFPTREVATRLRDQTFTLSEFLVQHAPHERIPKLHRKAVVQTHCHHHAVLRFDAEKTIFDAMELDADVLKSGCCGMAGSFGFQKDTYDVGHACGERALLPRVRETEADTFVLADGFSCKTQIEQATKRRALHLAEVLAIAVRHGAAGPINPTPYVESAYLGEIDEGIARSKRRAAFVLAFSVALIAVIVFVIVALAERAT
jgi:Fe-S oxidoreductase